MPQLTEAGPHRYGRRFSRLRQRAHDTGSLRPSPACRARAVAGAAPPASNRADLLDTTDRQLKNELLTACIQHRYLAAM